MSNERAYREGYAYLRELIGSLDGELLDQPCPHCPEWSLKGVLAHLTSVAEGGKGFEGPANFREYVMASIINADDEAQEAAAVVRDEFWNRVVASLTELPLDELWRRWDEALAQEPGPWRAAIDFAVHVGDIEEALGTSGSSGFELHGVALDRYTFLANENLRVRELPTVRVEGTSPEVSAGDDDAAHVIRGTTYDLLRAMTGRRTLAEADDVLDWTTTPADVKAVLPVYGWLTESRMHDRVR